MSCSSNAIVERLGLTLGDLFRKLPGASSKTGKPPTKAKPAKKPHKTPAGAIWYWTDKYGPFSQCWFYHDAKGHEAARVFRFDYPAPTAENPLAKGKTYVPVHPDADGWRAGDPPGLWPLYKLPHLVEAKRVFLVEGEKCADLVCELDELAGTTSAHGAKSTRKTDWSPLAGKEVVILPDKDEAGEGYTTNVLRELAKLNPRPTVRKVILPGLADPGDDIEQWLLLKNGTSFAIAAELMELAEAAPVIDFDAKAPPEKLQAEPVRVEDESPIHRTDLGNAQRLIKRFGDFIRFCPTWGKWLVWDGKRWREDETGEIFRLAKRTVRSIGAEAAEVEADGERKALLAWALQSESQKRIQAMIGLSWSEAGVPVEPSQLNRDPWLLNVENGTLDLRTGTLRPHQQADLISKLAPVAFDPAATCKRWEAFLARIFDGNADLVAFMQRALGYAISGVVSEHALFFLYGTGRNGKSTFLNIILGILGDYATTIDSSLLTVKRGDDHPTGLTDLDGRRFVPTSEVEDGRQMAEALVKKLTGGERIKARRMRENFYEFEPTHKIFLAANHKPEIRGTDEGIWSRIKLLPFDVYIRPEERTKDLDKILIAEEGPGILAWLVKGCLEWQRIGLADPAAIVKATEGYRAEMDHIGDYLGERCDCPEPKHLREASRTLASTLFHDYLEWAKGNGVEPLDQRKFGSEMTKRGFKSDKSNGKCWRYGLSVKPKEDAKSDVSGLF
ncbi:phage/plasmid primase, P4 family [Singulisphaera acidiphila]|nr:phage/plasmid primase, P4 family [Singulisphaera acidiphila]